jgi:hypothetical protein
MNRPPNRSEGELALERVLAELLAPLARLAIERGVKFPRVQELLKQAFVHAARARDPDAGERDISRVATTASPRRAASAARRPPRCSPAG